MHIVSKVAMISSGMHKVAGPPVVWLSVANLRFTDSLRDGGLNEEQVDRLVAIGGQWPPILVGRDGVVIDGVHRVVAARRLGFDQIEASMFDGCEDEALIEFVRRNVHHGLTLTLRERKRAARLVLGAHPDWSDRRIAEICAISPKTVGRLRNLEVARPSADNPQMDTTMRVGLDNRARPVNSASVRTRVVAAIKEAPDASLRTIAAKVGVSPETVRLVRTNMRTVPAVSVAAVVAAPAVVRAVEPCAPWVHDAALSAFDHGDFLGWFERTAVKAQDFESWLEDLPLSRVYQVADEARRRSELWAKFAKSLESRTVGRR